MDFDIGFLWFLPEMSSRPTHLLKILFRNKMLKLDSVLCVCLYIYIYIYIDR